MTAFYRIWKRAMAIESNVTS